MEKRKVRFIGASDGQVNYRGWDDPREHLTEGSVYELDREVVWDDYTDYYLVGFIGYRFNSVCFEEV